MVFYSDKYEQSGNEESHDKLSLVCILSEDSRPLTLEVVKIIILKSLLT